MIAIFQVSQFAGLGAALQFFVAFVTLFLAFAFLLFLLKLFIS